MTCPSWRAVAQGVARSPMTPGGRFVLGKRHSRPKRVVASAGFAGGCEVDGAAEPEPLRGPATDPQDG